MVVTTKQNLIFDIKRYAINDGPGIRVTIFFKGCPLSCQWCHNPEGMSGEMQKMYTKSLCIGAQECINVCKEVALLLTQDGVITDFNKCTLCGECADVCPTRAIEMSGREMTVEEIMDVIIKDLDLIRLSGGGVTFSGGEPLHHPKLLMPLIDACKKHNIHVCIDTSGLANKKVLLEVAEKADLFLYDLKLMDPQKHKKYTGVNNKQIIDNLIALAVNDVDFIIRIPLIAKVNDSRKDLTQFASFIASLRPGDKNVNIFPYHNTGRYKHTKLGNIVNNSQFKTPSEESLQNAIRIFKEYGITVEIGA